MVEWILNKGQMTKELEENKGNISAKRKTK
jgi:hypothetical protein